ncbi:hypothetical protein D3C74_348600 [compost metagenome]
MHSGNGDLIAFAEIQIRDRAFQRKVHAVLLQIFLQRQNNRVVLVIRRAGDSLQCMDSWELMHESKHVSFELHSTVPGLEGKRRRPHVPEIRLEKMWPKPIVNPRFAHFLLGGHHQLDHR